MRNNLPVTQRQYDFPADATLMSTTDTKSRITYANEAFVEASGFTTEELQGQPHNIVRHPDMPPEAFGDMWQTLQGGESWTGLVKNRRKNGDHYWVRANATPVMRNGQPVAYLSVRTRPSAEEIAGAERLYADMREGRARHLRIHKGVVVRQGAMAWTSMLKTMPVRWRVRLPVLALTVAAIVSEWMSADSLSGASLCIGAFVIVSMLAMWFLEAQVVSPMESLARHAKRVASGDTREPLQMDRVDEIGMALRSLNQMGLMFRWVIDDVAAQVVTVRSSSGDLLSGNNEISARTEQASASLQQTAASMEEMSATVRSNAGSLIVTATSEPALHAGHSYRLLLDGEAVGEPGRSPVFPLENIDRGTHKLAVEIVDANGLIVERTPAQPFHMLRTSLAQKRRVNPCKKDDYGVRPECPLKDKPKEKSNIPLVPFI